ncbi:hypothetical protein [Pseudomonas aeruginosa]|uniref:hypothetical protein n=1 Tax=Pseudomonas aeruginosa TaxID=287 RepID=UPI003F3C3DB9
MLTIKFISHNAVLERCIRQERLPCLCRVSNDLEILLRDPLPAASGLVVGWSRNELDRRVVEGAWKHEFTVNALLTLGKLDDGAYRIMDLDMFSSGFGWIALICRGNYVELPATAPRSREKMLLEYLRHFVRG